MMTAERERLGGGGGASEALGTGVGRSEDCCGRWILWTKLLQMHLIGRPAMSFVYAGGADAGRAALPRRGAGLCEGQELVERGAELEAREG